MDETRGAGLDNGLGAGSRRLLEAVAAVGSDLDVDAVLRRVVEAAAEAVGARGAALAVLAPGGGLARFVHTGIDAAAIAALGAPPEGRSLLGRLLEDPRPLRAADLRRHPAAVGLPAGHPALRSFLGVPVLVRRTVLGDLYLTEKAGGPFTAEDETVARALAAVAGAAVATARAHEDAERRERWLAVVADLRARLMAGASPEEVLDDLTARLLTLAGATAAFLALRHEEAGLYEIRAQAGEGLVDLRGAHLSRSGPVLSALARADGGAVLVDMTGAGHLGDDDHVAWGPGLAVPLHVTAAERAAVVLLRAAHAPGFDPALVPLVSGLADQVALALEMASRQRDARRLAVYEDRDRIARDLHDHVVQRLFAAGLSLQALLLRTTEEEVRRRLPAVVDQLDGTISDIRTTIFDLHTTGTTEGLRRRLLDAVAETAGGAVATVRLSGAVDTLLQGDLASDVLAVVREGVSNAVRHGRAGTIVVTLDVTGSRVVAEMLDDGRGIEPSAARSGLVGLEERATRRGGSAVVERRPEGGTLLRWSAPATG